jgi:hypothetical protein
MAAKTGGVSATKRSAPEMVETFLAALDHPFKPEILALRQIMLGADPGIAEGIKWNAPSFRTSEYFATFHLRAKNGVQVILHRGAKPRETAGIAINDPEGLLEWLGHDRASVTFRNLHAINTRSAAFADIIRQWITYV